MHEMEDTDMTYKSLAQAQQKLTLAEARYNKQNFANVREEKVQVAEIDRIRRNITKLAKYLPLVEERKSLELAIKGLRQDIRVVYFFWDSIMKNAFSWFVQKCALTKNRYMNAKSAFVKSKDPTLSWRRNCGD